jgi:hypothetical protein
MLLKMGKRQRVKGKGEKSNRLTIVDLRTMKNKIYPSPFIPFITPTLNLSMF